MKPTRERRAICTRHLIEAQLSKYRSTKFHYYDWDFHLWFGCETRARCRVLPSEYPMGLLANAAEGAYRNLLDYCYQEGDIPADIGGMSALCGMSPETFELVWPAFRNKFHVHKSKLGRLVHEAVSLRRRIWKQKKKQTADAGAKSASKQRTEKAYGINCLDNERTTTVQREFPSVHHGVVSSKELVVKETNKEKALPPNGLPENPADWSQRLYGRHPKKKNRVLVEQVVCKLWDSTPDPQALFERVDPVHDRLCQTADWNKHNGSFAPQLAEWLDDEGYNVADAGVMPEIGPYKPSWAEEETNG